MSEVLSLILTWATFDFVLLKTRTNRPICGYIIEYFTDLFCINIFVEKCK